MPSIAIPVSLRGQLLAGTGFNPASLFAVSGSRGFMYDLSDYSSQFQDTGGTTPITATSQSVGLVLDKSQGLALGPELVTNGDFSSGLTGWTDSSTAPSNMSVVGGVAVYNTNGLVNARLRQTVTTVVGRTYQFKCEGGNGSSFAIGTTSGGAELVSFRGITSGVVNSVYFVATTTTTWINTTSTANGATLDNVSVKELAGNHATQATAGNRALTVVFPSSGVRNRANGSADVGNTTIWRPTTQNGITTTRVGSGFDTDGLPYVDVRYQGTATSTVHDQIYLTTQASQSATSGQSYTASLIARVIAGSTTNVAGLLVRTAEFTAPSTFVGIALGAAVTASTDTVTTATRAITTGNLLVASIALTFTNGATIDVTYRIKALQFELGSSRTNYQFNYSAQNVTEVPFASIRGIQFDGVDDWLQTAAIDFSNSDEITVVAGVRKLNDGVIGSLVELTVAADANNGGFYLRAPTSVGGNNYQGASRGTLTSATTATGFTAPVSNVVTFQSKIAADNAALRVNQTAFPPSVADQGTGNFANAIVYIGRRGGSSLPFNGVLTFLFVINRLLSASELAAVEQFANSRTGAF